MLPNCVDAIAALFGAAKAGLYPVPVNARYKSLELADLIRHSRMRALFISPPDPASPAAPDFPALLAAAFPALASQDRTALALDDAPDLHQIVVLGEAPPAGFRHRGRLRRGRGSVPTATCSAAASWSRSATLPSSCTPRAPRPSPRARCSATRP